MAEVYTSYARNQLQKQEQAEEGFKGEKEGSQKGKRKPKGHQRIKRAKRKRNEPEKEKGPKREVGVEKANMSHTRVGKHEAIINPWIKRTIRKHTRKAKSRTIAKTTAAINQISASHQVRRG